MEPTQAKIIYRLFTTVQKVEEKFTHVFDGKHLERSDSIGWYIQFTGSNESIHFGEDKPEWKVGDRIEITFRRTQ